MYNVITTYLPGTGWSFQVYLVIISSLLEDSQFVMFFLFPGNGLKAPTIAFIQ